MTSRLDALCFAANDPVRLATFWSAALGWEVHHEASDDMELVPTDGTRFGIVFRPTLAAKRGKNRIHLDLTSTSIADQEATVRRLIDLGARRVDIGQGPDAPHTVLADPEGNELCVVGPNNFVADGGFIGSITCDAAGPAVGYFWSEVLGWPLVWDQDDETAIRAPDGVGQFITFGPPLPPKVGRNRVTLDIAAAVDTSAEVDRLVALGATRLEIGDRDAGRAVLADLDGNEFSVVPRR